MALTCRSMFSSSSAGPETTTERGPLTAAMPIAALPSPRPAAPLGGGPPWGAPPTGGRRPGDGALPEGGGDGFLDRLRRRGDRQHAAAPGQGGDCLGAQRDHPRAVGQRKRADDGGGGDHPLREGDKRVCV